LAPQLVEPVTILAVTFAMMTKNVAMVAQNGMMLMLVNAQLLGLK